MLLVTRILLLNFFVFKLTFTAMLLLFIVLF